MTPVQAFRSRWLTWALATGLVFSLGLGIGPARAMAQARSPEGSATKEVLDLANGPDWQSLTPHQRTVLQPLAARWAELDDGTRDKWVSVANRFDRLSPVDQRRVQDRMTQWSKLTPKERGEARMRFQQWRQLSPQDRQRKWEAYQALSPEARKDLQRQARRKAKPVFLPDNAVGPREARQVFTSKRNVAQGSTPRKSNMVPSPTAGAGLPPTVVDPVTVKAGPGATTTFVTQTPAPPLYQHTGLPKIAASQDFVDPVTMLPQRGLQSAGMERSPTREADAEPRSDKHKRRPAP